MSQVFWLVLSLSSPANLLHVGNFPNMETCQTAAKQIWPYVSNSGSTIAYYALCVPANTGKQSDPGPPP